MTKAAGLLDAVLRSIAETYSPQQPEELTGFSATVGHDSAGGLMVIGRAVNGWSNSWTCADISNSEGRARIVQEILNSSSGGQSRETCPMAWVNLQWGSKDGYSTARSPFWRSIRSVLSELGLADGNGSQWASRLFWTNLFKVAPSAGGNPSNALITAQHAACRNLLHFEIATSHVSKILFLTGLDWSYAFLPPLRNVRFADSYGRHVALHGLMTSSSGEDTSVVVASHPQGKKRAEWVEDVVGAFAYN